MTIFRKFSGLAAVTASVVAVCLVFAPNPAFTAEAGESAVQLAEATPVSVRFSWKLKGEYAPFYVALDKGYFTDAGVKVKLGEGAGSQATLAAVDQGHETATFAPAIYGLQAISKGLDVKIISLYHPAIPLGFLSHPKSPVRTPKDLEGMTMVTSVGDTVADFLNVFCHINKVDCGKVKKVKVHISARLSSFLGGKADTMGTYNHIDVPTLHSKGHKDLVLLDATKFGLTLPGGSLIVSNKTIKDNPKALSGLLKGLHRGYADTKKDPRAAARILMKFWETSLHEDVVTEQVKQTVAAVPDYSGKPYGWIDEGSFSKSLGYIKAAGKIKKVLALDKYYTNALNR